MKTYEATALYDASAAGNFSVEAESLEQALEALEEQVAEHSASLCHQCSDKLNLGDMTGMIVYCDDEEVADTTYHGERIAKLEAEAQALREELAEARGRADGMAEQIAALRARVAVPDALLSAFITAESGNDKYQIVMRFSELKAMQEAHNYLARLNGKAVSEGLLRRIAAPRPKRIADEYAWRLDQGKAIEELGALLGEGKEHE